VIWFFFVSWDFQLARRLSCWSRYSTALNVGWRVLLGGTRQAAGPHSTLAVRGRELSSFVWHAGRLRKEIVFGWVWRLVVLCGCWRKRSLTNSFLFLLLFVLKKFY